MLTAGDAVVLPQPGNPTPHLWILLTALDANGCAAVVNITSTRAGADQTVVLRPGDHPFIHHASVVAFADARIANVALLDRKLDQAGGHRERPCSPALLQKIREGALRSPFTPNKIKHYLRANPTTPER